VIFDINDKIRFWSKYRVDKSGCWIWTASTCCNGNYGAIRLPNKVQVGAHVFSYMMHIGNIPDGLQVCHKCDNGLCVNPDHLFLGTQQDNVDDMIAKGRQARGERLNHRCQIGDRNHASKLSESAVRKIKKLLLTCSQAEVSRLTGVSRANIWNIAHGKSWVHI
jgi:hypothetical protein